MDARNGVEPAQSHGTIPNGHGIPKIIKGTSPPPLKVTPAPLLNFNGPPPSAGAFRTNFEIPPSPTPESSFNHNSISSSSLPTPNITPPTQFLSPSLASTPPSPNPLSPTSPSIHRRGPSISFAATPPSPRTPSFSPSQSFPPNGPRRHGRIHSRNLSVFFPRPGSEAATAIAEDDDGSQEIEYPNGSNSSHNHNYSSTPSPLIPNGRKFGDGFKFGGSKSIDSLSSDNNSIPLSSRAISGGGNVSQRRGHHHKHSLSHNFFSFMEPGGTAQQQEAMTPSTPAFNAAWASASGSPFLSTPHSHAANEKSAVPNGAAHPLPTSYSATSQQGFLSVFSEDPEKVALVFFGVQFLIGACMWAAGQSRGSLACTGLGYWIVFDSFGVAISSRVVARLWSTPAETAGEDDLRRPFGSRRLETTAAFSQAIYLLFSAVYVMKEAVEHFLLASDEDDSHHHHRGDEHLNGIVFPTTLLIMSLVSLIFSNLYYSNHSRLVDATGTALPDPLTAFSSTPFAFVRRSARPILKLIQSSPIATRLLSNPFTLAPACFSLLLLYAACFADRSQHVSLDMFISTLETVWTFSIAYPTAVSLGKILLQTAPERNLPGGPMESFLRVMREIERHPQVVHLPAPHLWQLTLPRLTSQSGGSGGGGSGVGEAELVATVELHVRQELTDMEIVELTRWASDKCSIALGRPKAGNITVSVVRG